MTITLRSQSSHHLLGAPLLPSHPPSSYIHLSWDWSRWDSRLVGPLVKDPAGAPAELTGLHSSPEEGEGWPPWNPVPGQGPAPPHYLLLQSLLHPPTPNRDYRPSTVSNCPDSGRGWTLAHTTQPWPPQPCPAVERGCLLLWELGEPGRGPPGGHCPHPGLPPELEREAGLWQERPRRASQACSVSCFGLKSAVSASLSLGLLFPPPPEHTWLLTSDNTTTAPLAPACLLEPPPRPHPLPPLPPPLCGSLTHLHFPGEGWGGVPKALKPY